VCDEFAWLLGQQFRLSNQGPVSSFLGINVQRSGNTILLNRIDGYADADWGSDLTQRKSTTGYLFVMNGGPVSWTSRKQTTVALSTMEAEYMALSDAAREPLAHLTFSRTTLFIQYQFPSPLPSPSHVTDNPVLHAEHISLTPRQQTFTQLETSLTRLRPGSLGSQHKRTNRRRPVRAAYPLRKIPLGDTTRMGFLPACDHCLSYKRNQSDTSKIPIEFVEIPTHISTGGFTLQQRYR
jgi:hypothetical protein